MDIQNEDDIKFLVDSFYTVARKDEAIGFIFNDLIGDDWSHHLPIMYQFWGTILIASGNYAGNPVIKHVDIDRKIPLKKEHFERWLQLWTATVNNLFQGPKAEEAKKKGALMKDLILMKVTMAKTGKPLM